MPQKIIGVTLEATDNASPAIKSVNQAATDANKTLKDTNTTIKETGGSFSNLKESISKVPGPLGEASEGVSKLSDSFKALLANPVVLVITAIVGALAFLYKSFTNTASGAEEMEAQLAGIKAAAKAVLDAVFDLGGAIIKFFSGDFKGAFEQAKQAITGVVDAVGNAYTATKGFTKQLQELHKEQLVADVAASKRAADLAKLREQALDPEVPVAQRKVLIKQLADIEDKAAEEDIARAKKVANAKIGLLSIGKDAVLKNRDEIAQAQIDLNNKEADAENEKRRINRLAKQADKQEAAEAKAEAAAAAAEAKKKREQDQAFEAQLRKIHEETVLASITDQYAKETQLLENKIADENASLKKQFTDGKLTRSQYNELTIAEDENAAVRRLSLIDKHNKELEDAEEKHQAELEKLRQQAIKQQQAEELAAQKKQLEDSKKHTNTVINDPKAAFKVKQAALDAENKQLKASFDAKIITESEYNDEVEKLEQARDAIRKKEQQEQLQLAGNTATLLGTLSDAVGKNTQAGKDLSIASATISAFTTIANIIEGFSSLGPFGIAAGVAAAAAAAVGLFNNIKQIEAVNVPGQGGSSSSIGSPSIPVIASPVAPTQTSTAINQSSINQIGQQVQPVQAYVVEQQGAEAANRAARLAGQSVLGGH